MLAAGLANAQDPPDASKKFGTGTIAVGASTTLTITLSNPNATPLTNVGIVDHLPAGIAVDPLNLGVTGNCSTAPVNGTVNAPNAATIALTNATLAANASCQFSVKITGVQMGAWTNLTDAPTATGTSGGVATSADIKIVGPPVISKSFSTARIKQGGIATLNFTISNPVANPVTLTNVVGGDSVPQGLLIAPTPNASACAGGTIPIVLPSTVNPSIASLAAGASCSYSVDIIADGTVFGTIQNSATVTSTNGGAGISANATIYVVSPPQLDKSFSPAGIPVNGTGVVSFILTNPNLDIASSLSGISFTDDLPAGLIFTDGLASASCPGGTISAAPSGTHLVVSGVSLNATGLCSFSLGVKGTTPGVKPNVTSAPTSNEGGPGAPGSAQISVLVPPTLTKSFGAASLPVNGTTSLTLTLANPNPAGTTSLTGVSFTDALPAGLVIATPPALSGTCTGVTANAGATTITLAPATRAPGFTCTVIVNVTVTTAGRKDNSVTPHSNNGGDGNAATASLNVFAPPTISKSFNPTSVPLNGNSTLTITITNPNPVGPPALPSLTGIGFTDTLTNMVVASTPNVSNSCGGTANVTAGANSFSLSGVTLASGQNCSISLSVTAKAVGSLGNTTGPVHSTEGGDGNPGTATLLSFGPPTLTKAFSPLFIPASGTSTLGFVVTNPNATLTLSAVAFADTLPNDVTINGGVQNSTCAGAVITATPGTNVINFSGLTLAGGGSCSFEVKVTAPTAGAKINVTGAITSTEGGTGLTATSTLTVASPPTLIKSFGALSVPVGGTTSLTLTLSNPNATVALTGVTFNDVLPAGLVVATPLSVGGTCTGVTAAAGGGSVSLNIANFAAGASCTVIINVTGTSSGKKDNLVTPKSTNGGDGAPANASINVFAPPAISKAFSPSSVPINTNSTLTVTITNPNVAGLPPLTGIGFTDNMTGTVVATPVVVGNLCGGTPTVVAGAASFSLAGVTLASGANCTFAVSVTAKSAGTLSNTTGPPHSNEGGDGTPGTGTLTSVLPPTITKVFTAPAVQIGGQTTLTITVTNPNAAVTLNNVSMTDTLPAGIEVVTPTPNAGTCFGGTFSTTTTSITFTGGSIPAGQSCGIPVLVKGTALGTLQNTATATSSNGGDGDPAKATLTVTPLAPVLTKSFGAPNIPLDGTTTLTFKLSNPNTDPALGILNGINFTDSLPAGLVIATPNGLVTGCVPPGTLTAPAGTSTISLSGVTLAANTNCTFTVTVKGVSAGGWLNTTSPVHATGTVDGQAASADIFVVPHPVITKTFTAHTINLGQSTPLTFTISYPAAAPLAAAPPMTGITFVDTLPDVIIVSTPNNLVGGCGGGVIATTSTTVSLTGATLQPGQSCTFSINVTGKIVGTKTNTVQATTDNAGPSNIANDTITVFNTSLPPTLLKSFSAQFVQSGGSVIMTLVLSNPNPFQLTGLGFTDILPAGLIVSTPNNGLSTTCNGTTTAVAGSSTVSLSGASLAASASCTIMVSVTATANPTVRVCNVTSEVVSDQTPKGAPGEACLTVGSAAIAPPDGFQIRYAGNLNVGDAVINLSNSGALSGFDPQGQICVNTYTFSPDEQLVSCCTCLVTPNALNSLSAKKDLISNTLTPAAPASIVIKLLASLPQAGKCDAAAPTTFSKLAPGLLAWGSTLHVPPYAADTSVTETAFTKSTLSAFELQRITSLCGFIQSNGSGFGVCASCRSGGL